MARKRPPKKATELAETGKKAKAVKPVPKDSFYKDVIRPGARAFGKSAAAGGGAAGEMFSVFMVGVQSMFTRTMTRVVQAFANLSDPSTPVLARIIEDVPEERLMLPEPSVAVPALESLALVGHEPTLADMYIKLLATVMDSQSADDAHPAFAEIIRQMTPDEARLLKFIHENRCIPTIKVLVQDKVPQGQIHPLPQTRIVLERHYHRLPEMEMQRPIAMRDGLDNLCRLGLILHDDRFQADSDRWDALIADSRVQEWTVRNDLSAIIMKGGYYLTKLGQRFCRACIEPHGSPETAETPKGD
jgi:hypothetical protein